MLAISAYYSNLTWSQKQSCYAITRQTCAALSDCSVGLRCYGAAAESFLVKTAATVDFCLSSCSCDYSNTGNFS